MIFCNNKASCVVEHKIGEKYINHTYLYRTDKHIVGLLGRAGIVEVTRW